MQIKIGFTQHSRELQIISSQDQEDVMKDVRAFLGSTNATEVLELESAKGDRHLVLREHVAYVEVGNSSKGTVGFL